MLILFFISCYIFLLFFICLFNTVNSKVEHCKQHNLNANTSYFVEVAPLGKWRLFKEEKLADW